MYYKLSCPVPKNQRPLNEYLKLIQSTSFNWVRLSKSEFLKALKFNYFLSVLLSIPILFFSSPDQYFVKKIFFIIFVSLLVYTIYILRIFLAWIYVEQRLYSSTIFYEESGWYDGCLWIKPKIILITDRIIREYQVLPILQRVKFLIFILLNLITIDLILLQFL